MTLLLSLFYFYRKSPKQKKNLYLYAIFASLNMKSIQPTRVDGARWLPHINRVINAFLKGYRTFLLQLQNASHNNPKAEGFAKLAGDGHVIVFILYSKVNDDSD